MSIPLQPEENVYFPMPYVEGEAHLLVITNQRVVHYGDAGKQELAAKQIQFVGRMSTRPLVAVGIVLALLGLVTIGTGVYFIITSGVLSGIKTPALPGAAAGDDPAVAAPEGAPAEAAADDPAGAPASADPSGGANKILGFVAAGGGLVLLLVGGLLFRIERHFVVVRGGAAVLQIKAASPMEQTQILATLGALQSATKNAPPAPAAAPAAPAVQVDDKGDPVKALQDLAAQRAAGKVSEDEFDAKREILLARVRARK